MTTTRRDWVSLVEATYCLTGDDEAWLDNLLERATPILELGTPPLAWTIRYTPTTFGVDVFARRSSPLLKAMIRAGHHVASDALANMVYRSGRAIGTASADVFPKLPGELPKFRVTTGGRFRDLLLVGGHSGTGQSVMLAAYSTTPTVVSAAERKRWQQIGAHLGAGLRLRDVARELSMDAHPVEAVLDSCGRVHDAREEASDNSALDALRHAVRKIERVRSRAWRDDPDVALDAWEGLVDGRWSLVDRFDTDGRRFVVAVRNDPDHRDPRGLSRRERQVAEYIGMGRSTKQISYTLGISASAVADCSARVQRKLGLSSRAEVSAFFAQSGPRARLAEVAIRDERLLVGAYPLMEARRIATLTDAERDVLAKLLAGATNRDIARRRDSSERTVANQVQSIFRKVGARSRSELAFRLQSPA